MFTNIYEAESAIQILICKDNNCSTHFDYTSCSNTCTCKIVTFNPLHKTHFLLHSITENDKLTAVNQMYNYVYKLKETLTSTEKSYNSYTVKWYSKSQEKSYTSYFYGNNMLEILQKFYYGKHENSLIIYSIKT